MVGGGAERAFAIPLELWEPQVPHLLMGSQQGVQLAARMA